jgi:hypothetical protein
MTSGTTMETSKDTVPVSGPLPANQMEVGVGELPAQRVSGSSL